MANPPSVQKVIVGHPERKQVQQYECHETGKQMNARKGIKGCLYSLACLFITVVLSCGVFFYVLFSAMRWDQLMFLPVSTNIEGYEVVVLENGVVRLNSSSCKVLLSLLSRTKRNDRFEFTFYITPKADNIIVIDSIKYNVTTVSGKTLRLTQYFPDQRREQNGRLVTFGRILNVDIPKQYRRRPVVVTLSFVLKEGKEGKEQKHEITLMLRPQIVTWWMPLAGNLKQLRGRQILCSWSLATNPGAECIPRPQCGLLELHHGLNRLPVAAMKQPQRIFQRDPLGHQSP